MNALRTAALIAAAAFSAAMPAGEKANANEPDGAGVPGVYVIGDSISIQYGPYVEQYLRGFMRYARKEDDSEARLGLPEPLGQNGGDSAMVRRFVEAAAAQGGLGADILLLNCGLHDIKTDPETGAKQVPIEQYEENLRHILAAADRMGMKVVWVRTTPVDERVHNTAVRSFHRFAADCAAYNAVADRVMTGAGVPIIDLFAFTNNLGSGLFADHVHFPEPVREKQGAFIAGWLIAWWDATAPE